MKSFSLIILLICIITLFSCNQNKTLNQETTTDSLVTEEKALLIDENEKCFLATVGKDSAFLKINLKEAKATGSLNYQFFEKDKNKGTIEGTLNQDTLNLIYTFSSEGSISTRPLKMLINKNQIFEIYGNEIAKEGQGFIYNPSDCKDK